MSEPEHDTPTVPDAVLRSLQTRCPVCGARPGTVCKVPTGSIGRTHVARLSASQEPS